MFIILLLVAAVVFLTVSLKASLPPYHRKVSPTARKPISTTTTQDVCQHDEVVPVETISGEIVAHICLLCDRDLNKDFVPPAARKRPDPRFSGGGGGTSGGTGNTTSFYGGVTAYWTEEAEVKIDVTPGERVTWYPSVPAKQDYREMYPKNYRSE